MYYHVVRREFYAEGRSFDTAEINWGRSLSFRPVIGHACDTIFDFSLSRDEAIGPLVDIYCWRLENGLTAEECFYHYQNFGGGRLMLADIRAFFAQVDGQSVSLSGEDNSIRLWDCAYDRVRRERFSTLPSRFDSCFAFPDLADAEDYLEESRAAGRQAILCELHGAFQRNPIAHDRKHIDALGRDHTFKEADLLLRRYWSGELTDEPVIEYHLQGSIIFGRAIAV